MPPGSSAGKFYTSSTANSSPMFLKREFQISCSGGLNRSRCDQLIERFNTFHGKITISNGAISVNGRSLSDLLQLAAITQNVVTVEIVGQQADQLMRVISPIFAGEG